MYCQAIPLMQPEIVVLPEKYLAVTKIFKHTRTEPQTECEIGIRNDNFVIDASKISVHSVHGETARWAQGLLQLCSTVKFEKAFS